MEHVNFILAKMNIKKYKISKSNPLYTNSVLLPRTIKKHQLYSSQGFWIKFWTSQTTRQYVIKVTGT